MKRCVLNYTLDSGRAEGGGSFLGERVDEGLFSELQTAVKRYNDHHHRRSGKIAASIQQTLRFFFFLQNKQNHAVCLGKTRFAD